MKSDDVVLQRICEGLPRGIKTSVLDDLIAQTVASFATQHSDFVLLAGRVEVSNLHKTTEPLFSSVVDLLYNHKNPNTNRDAPLVSSELHLAVQAHKSLLDDTIVSARDYSFDYFGIKTLKKSYLLSSAEGHIFERPQYLFMRVALGIHMHDIKSVIETYDCLSQQFFIHATPTLMNAGTGYPQLSSCFLTCVEEDSIDGIYDTLKDCAIISKYGGGIGLGISNVRADRSYINGTNGVANGIVPMLRVFNNSARYVDQGGGKRKGSIAVYIEPWHQDVFSFLDLKKNSGNEMERARDLFYALWMPDLFMERVEADLDWTLFCPNECKNLEMCWGREFRFLYEQYEREGKGRSTIKSRQLWFAIIEAQVETGTPFILYKDHCNRKSNQQNLGTIRCSNLCAEIVQYTSSDEIAVCNLASINLPKFVSSTSATFDFDKLRQVAKVATRNLDKIINRNYYPLEKAEKSNQSHRPIGIGVQGLADVFQMMHLPFESPKAHQLCVHSYYFNLFGYETARLTHFPNSIQ